MLLQLHHADWYTYQFQMAEWACACKDRALTSSHALSYLLHLLIVTALAGRIQKITMQLTHLHFLHVVVRGINLPFLLLECDFFHDFNLYHCWQ